MRGAVCLSNITLFCPEGNQLEAIFLCCTFLVWLTSIHSLLVFVVIAARQKATATCLLDLWTAVACEAKSDSVQDGFINFVEHIFQFLKPRAFFSWFISPNNDIASSIKLSDFVIVSTISIHSVIHSAGIRRSSFDWIEFLWLYNRKSPTILMQKAWRHEAEL